MIALKALLSYCVVFSATCYAGDKCLDKIAESVRLVCQAPGQSGKYWDVSLKGRGDAQVKIRNIELGGISAEALFTKSEWEGVQQVLKDQQAADNLNYRACAREITKLFVSKANCLSKPLPAPPVKHGLSKEESKLILDIGEKKFVFVGRIADRDNKNPDARRWLALPSKEKIKTINSLLQKGLLAFTIPHTEFQPLVNSLNLKPVDPPKVLIGIPSRPRADIYIAEIDITDTQRQELERQRYYLTDKGLVIYKQLVSKIH